MNENERNIYRLLRGWRRLSVEKQFFESRCDLSQEQREERLAQMNHLLELLESGMMLLTADERYIIKRHLMDEVNWSRIVYEYNTKLLRPVRKSCSTLRRMQSSAIAKMARHAIMQWSEWERVAPVVLSGCGL